MTAATSRSNLKAAYLLTTLVAATMAIASAVGTFSSHWLYRDNPLILATFRGQDAVTLFLAVPLLLLGLVLEMRGSLGGRVLWIAMLFYGFYGYLFYAVGAAFNVFFLLYVAVFGLAFYALIFSVPRIDPSEIDGAITSTFSRRFSIAYMAVVACGLSAIWIGFAAGYIVTGVVPGPIVASGHPTGVVFAIDLAFMVPPMVLGALWLYRRRPWGGFLAAVLAVNGAVYTLTLAVASFEVVRAGAGTGGELPLWVALTAFGAIAAALLLAQLKPKRRGAIDPENSMPHPASG